MVAVIIALVVVALVVGFLLARRGAAGVQGRIEARLAGLDVQRQDKATFHGLASAGEGQARALGTLVLTADDLLFLQFVPDREVRVPRSAITGARTSEEFLGASAGRPLLVVDWTDGDLSDEAAWDIPDVDAWRSLLG